MKQGGPLQAAEITIEKAIDMIVARHPNVARAEVQRFALQQFQFMNADPNEVISAERIVQRFEAEIARPDADTSRTRERLVKLIFRGLNGRPSHQSLQYFELQHAFQVATGESISKYAGEVVATVNELQDKGYIRWTSPGNRMPLIFQGIDFDEWSSAMNGDKDVPRSVTYNVTGSNARINHRSTDNSTNVVAESGAIQEHLAALRRSIGRAELSVADQQSALEVVDAVDAQFASGTPKKSIVTALLGALPKIAEVATIAGTVIALVK